MVSYFENNLAPLLTDEYELFSSCIFVAQKIAIHEDIICDTCLKDIEFLPARVVTMKSWKGKTMNLHFHYFFPCWDFEHLCQSYPEYDLVNMGFIYDSDYITTRIIKNLRKNEDLWI